MDYSHFGRDLNKNLYFSTLKPVLVKKALFADYTSDYVDPPEPNAYSEVTLRFRTYKSNADRVRTIQTTHRKAKKNTIKMYKPIGRPICRYIKQ